MDNSKKDSRDVISLIRFPIVVVLAIVYNVIAITVLWRFDFSFFSPAFIGTLILFTFLAFKYSRPIKRLVQKPDSSPSEFDEKLSFPIILWGILTSVALLVGTIELIMHN